MLDSMRALSKSLVSKLLIGLLVISFAIWGVGDMVGGSGMNYAAKVGDSTIGISEFQRQRSIMSQQLQSMGMTNLPAGQLEFAVMRQLVQEKLTLMAMQDIGLYVNEALLAKSIANMREFRDESGKFSREKYQNVIKGQGIQERTFLSQIKREIAGNFMIESLEMADAPLPGNVLAIESLIEGETRDAVLITVPARDAMDEANTTALTEFYEQNKTLFMTPESRTLEYIALTESDIDALVDAAITPEEIADKIAATPSLNEGLVRIKLRAEKRDSVMLEVGNAIEDELAAGKTMGEAVAIAGVKSAPRTLANATEEQAKISADDVTKTVIEQGFTLSEGEISRLISSAKGTKLMVSLKAITPSSPKPFEQVKAEVKSRLAKQLAKDAARAKAMTVQEELGKSTNWQSVTSTHNLPARVVSRVERPSALEKPDASIPPALRQAMFERKVGEVAGPLALENGDQVFALVTAAHLPKVDVSTLKPSKSLAATTEQIGQTIQGRAYNYFTSSHPVEVNPAIMKAPEQPQP